MFHKSVFLCQTSFSFSEGDISVVILYEKTLLLCYIAILYGFSGCSPKQPEKDYTWLKQGIETAALQLKFTVAEIGDSIRLPRSIWTGYDTDFLCRQLDKKQLTGKDSARLKPIHDNLGSRRYCFSIYDWTSGFSPAIFGSLINLPAMKA